MMTFERRADGTQTCITRIFARFIAAVRFGTIVTSVNRRQLLVVDAVHIRACPEHVFFSFSACEQTGRPDFPEKHLMF